MSQLEQFAQRQRVSLALRLYANAELAKLDSREAFEDSWTCKRCGLDPAICDCEGTNDY